jgi:hypothetical protein
LRHDACSVWLSCTSVQSFALRCGHVVVKRTALSWQTFLLGSVRVVQVSLVQQRVESGRVCSLTRELPEVPQDSSQVTLRRACGALPGGTRGLHATLTVCRRTGKAKMFSPTPATRQTVLFLDQRRILSARIFRGTHWHPRSDSKTREAAPHTLEMRYEHRSLLLLLSCSARLVAVA